MNKYWAYNKTNKVIPLNTSNKTTTKKRPNIIIKKRKTTYWMNLLHHIFK